MKSFINHYHGIRITFTELFKGKYLVYFIPGVVVSIIYWYFVFKANSIEISTATDTGYSWVDWATGWVDTGVSKVVDYSKSLLGTIMGHVYAFVILTFLSPFNTSLAEKLDNSQTGNVFDSNVIRFINDFIRMIFVVILAVFLEFALMLLYWLVSWMFGLDAIDPVVYHIIAAFFFGFSFYDFGLERYQKGVFTSLYYAFEKPLTMILTGTIFLLIYEIPYIGIPLAPVLTVMISTIVYLYNEKKLPVSSQNKQIENE